MDKTCTIGVTIYMIVYVTRVLFDYTRLIWGLESISLKSLYQVWYTKYYLKLYCYRQKLCQEKIM